MRLAFVCDFDGTVSPTDVGAALVRRFTTDRGRVAGLVERWRAGEIGTREGIQAGGCEVVLVGDGLSDRCAAAAADQVLACGELLEWCRAQSIAATAFEDFADVGRAAPDRPRRRSAGAGG